MAQRKKTKLGGKKCSKFTYKISKQSTGFTLLFFLTSLENRTVANIYCIVAFAFDFE